MTQERTPAEQEALSRSAALIAQADAWYAAQGVKDPARMTALLVPGW